MIEQDIEFIHMPGYDPEATAPVGYRWFKTNLFFR
jgi:hypothetical protein